MKKYEDFFSDILSDMVFLCLEYSKGDVDKIFIHCSNENNCITSNIFFQKGNKKLKRSQLINCSESEQKNIIHNINEKIKNLEYLCKINRQAVPTVIKLIYDVTSKNLITDFLYDELYSNTKEKIVQDIFDAWFESV